MPTLDWIGKKAVVNHHRQLPYHLLRCDNSLSCGDPDSGNLLVEGDNLLALKALLPYYAGQVKCIYIDPPYNTGKEYWKYNDAVNSPEIRKWLGKLVGDELEDLSRHDKWLCMMYPRLVLLRDFLTEDGIILVSIGDHEIARLRILMDDIFGIRNHFETFVWNTEGHTEKQESVTTVHEYIVAYSRKPESVKVRNAIDPNVSKHSKIRRDFAENSITKNTPRNPASLVTLPIGFPCEASELKFPRFERFNEFQEEVNKLGYITRSLTRQFDAVYPVRKDNLVVNNYKLGETCTVLSGWSSLNKLKKFIENGSKPIEDEGTQLSFYLSPNGVIYYRRGGRISHYVQSVLRNMGTTERNRYELEAMGVHFDYPKPKELITYLISLFAEDKEIVMDSFIGSGTTAHAVQLLNTSDDGKRRFIGIELDQKIATTATQPRVKCVIEGYVAKSGKDKGKRIEGLGGGFRYCRLDKPLFDETGKIGETVKFADLAAHVFFTETGGPIPKRANGASPFLGTANGTGYYLLFNGILGDKTPDGGNVLTGKVLASLPKHNGPKVIFGEGCRLGDARLTREQIIFKQLPYEIKVS